VAVTRETLKLIGKIRIQVADSVNAATDDLVRAWANAWTLVVDDWTAVVAEVETLRVDGRWPSQSQILRLERAQRALEATYAGLTRLSDQAGVRIIASVSDVLEAAQGHVPVIASQLPTTGVVLRGSLVRADTNQIEAIVLRTQQQVTKDLFPLGADSYDIIRRNLIQGVAQGQNPRVTARKMVDGLEAGFNKSLTRAMNIAWTETLDAHRAGALAVRKANADVIAGWDWLSALDSRTCPSCFARHGTHHPADEPGPIDHPQGRCTALPRTKTWAELGFDIEEPPSLMPDAQTVFNGLSPAEQLNVMGPKRLQLLKDGDVDWSDLSTLRTSPGWRDSYGVTPIKNLTGAS
jgi:SPP1 gp7 family putative phage head morphogenesis protein